jgi:prepilin-type processing-associated H-X9-DG protein
MLRASIALVALSGWVPLSGCSFDGGGLPAAAGEDVPPAQPGGPAAPEPDTVPDGHPACPLSAELVGCYRFENELGDASGRGNHVTGSAYGFATGRHGQAVRTTASSTLLVPENALLELDHFTIELWLRAAELPEDGRRAGLVDRQGSFGLFLHDDGELRCVAGGQTVTRNDAVRAGTWIHVACVHDGNAMTLYVDGHSASTGGASALPAGARQGLSIAGDNPTGDPFTGELDELRIWSGARSTQDICASAGSC